MHAGLCSWAINIIGFYEVYCDVEPKRKALAAANAELAAAQEKLAKIKAKIQVSLHFYRICVHTRVDEEECGTMVVNDRWHCV